MASAKKSTCCAFRLDLEANVPEGRGYRKLLWGLAFSQGFQLVLLWRLVRSMHSKGMVLRILSRLLMNVIANFYGCYLSPLAQVGAGIRFPHPVGVVIGDGAVIGDMVTIYQNVTVGVRSTDIPQYPKIGSGVLISAGAVVLGDVVIGRDSVIGANAVVLNGCPDRSTLVGVPARVVSIRPGT